MIDESKTEGQGTTDQKSSDTTVTITQEKLDSLISEKYKKGATKANADLLESLGVESLDSLKEIMKAKVDADDAAKSELEKAQEAVEALKLVNDELVSKGEKLEFHNNISRLASKNEIKDVDYFSFKYEQAKASEGFNEDTFISDFVKGNPTIAPKTDSSTTNNTDSRKGADLRKMTIGELKAYQNSL